MHILCDQVERIDHGIRSLEDPELIDYLRDKQLPLTVCPFSNVQVRRRARSAVSCSRGMPHGVRDEIGPMV